MPRPHAARRALFCRGLARNREASAAVEFAVVMPLLLAFVFGIIELGHLLWTVGALNMAVQDSARCASVSNVPTPPSTLCDTQQHLQTYAQARTWGMTVPANTYSLSTPACGYQVNASYVYKPIVGYIPLSMTLTASACYPAWQ
jgi:Flp pilus assembly protein TadG